MPESSELVRQLQSLVCTMSGVAVLTVAAIAGGVFIFCDGPRHAQLRLLVSKLMFFVPGVIFVVAICVVGLIGVLAPFVGF